MTHAVARFDSVATAAFLTQTVQLDDATTVKLEIWCVYLASAMYHSSLQLLLKGYCRSRTLQGWGLLIVTCSYGLTSGF